jgi:hypothetical protein
MPEKIPYFAYGTPRAPEMIKAVIGREPDGEEGTVHDYELAVQRPAEIPEAVKKILAKSWSPEEVENFHSYTIRRKIGAEVMGIVWELTPDERKIIDDWELNDGLWYRKATVDVVTPSRGIVTATTEMIDDPSFIAAKDLYPGFSPYTMPKERILEVANKLRVDFLARQAASSEKIETDQDS